MMISNCCDDGSYLHMQNGTVKKTDGGKGGEIFQTTMDFFLPFNIRDRLSLFPHLSHLFDIRLLSIVALSGVFVVPDNHPHHWYGWGVPA